MSKKQSTILVTTFILIAAVAVVIWGGERKQPEQPSPAGNGGDVVSQDSNIPQNREDIDTNDNDNDPISISDEDPIVITSDIDTSDWKTYRNEELGFEVKYPKSWYVLRQGEQFSPYPKDPNNDIGIFIGDLSKIVNTEGLDYNSAVSEVFKLSSYDYDYITKHEINLKGQNLIQAIGNRRSTFFMDDHSLIVISFVPAGEIPLDVYNAFLLSFKFIE